MIYAPLAIPAAPAPEIARPTIRVVLFFATAHINDPTSKTKIDSRNVPFNGKYLYPFPQVDWKEATVKKNAEPYHPTWSRELNSSVIRGIAVATMVMSRANRKIESIRAMTMNMREIVPGYSLLSPVDESLVGDSLLLSMSVSEETS